MEQNQEKKRTPKEEKKGLREERRESMGPEAGAMHKKLKAILSVVLILVVIAGCCVGVYSFSRSANYFVTDNAKVTAKMYNVMPVKTGELLEWNVELGDEVKKDQVLGRQDVLPYITSPIDGLVIKNDGSEGQMATPANPVAVIADTNNMYIGVNIEETDIVKIKTGQDADVTLDAYKGKKFKGTVTEIAQTTQTFFSGTSSFSTSGTYTKVTQLIPVRVDIENPENLPMTFGMNATVKIHLKSSVNAVANKEKQEPGQQKEPTYTANIEARTQMNVTPDVSGKVKTVNVTAGQNVKKGDVLFTLDDTELALQAKQAQAAYNAAQVTYNNSQGSYNNQSGVIPAQIAYDEAKTAYEQAKQLFAAGGISQTGLDAAKDLVDTTAAQLKAASTASKGGADSAKAQLNSAKAALDLALERKNSCVVKAPMSGHVLSCDIVPGDMVSQQTPPMVLYEPGTVILKIRVAETDISKVAAGTPADITLKATGEVFQGSVSRIAPMVDTETGTFEVEVAAGNESGRLKVGMAADVKLDRR